MLEDPCDRVSGSTIAISGAELVEWEILCVKFNLQDLWFMQSLVRRVDSLQFSRIKRRVSHFNLSRIDRYQFFWDLDGYLGIVLSTTFSDHAPVNITLKLRFAAFHNHVQIPM